MLINLSFILCLLLSSLALSQTETFSSRDDRMSDEEVERLINTGLFGKANQDANKAFTEPKPQKITRESIPLEPVKPRFKANTKKPAKQPHQDNPQQPALQTGDYLSDQDVDEWLRLQAQQEEKNKRQPSAGSKPIYSQHNVSQKNLVNQVNVVSQEALAIISKLNEGRSLSDRELNRLLELDDGLVLNSLGSTKETLLNKLYSANSNDRHSVLFSQWPKGNNKQTITGQSFKPKRPAEMRWPQEQNFINIGSEKRNQLIHIMQGQPPYTKSFDPEIVREALADPTSPVYQLTEAEYATLKVRYEEWQNNEDLQSLPILHQIQGYKTKYQEAVELYKAMEALDQPKDASAAEPNQIVMERKNTKAADPSETDNWITKLAAFLGITFLQGTYIHK